MSKKPRSGLKSSGSGLKQNEKTEDELVVEALEKVKSKKTTVLSKEDDNDTFVLTKLSYDDNEIQKEEISKGIVTKTKERVDRGSFYRKKNEPIEKPKEETHPKNLKGSQLGARTTSVAETSPDSLIHYGSLSTPSSPKLTTMAMSRKDTLAYKNRRMSWRSKNLSEERRDLSLIAMDDESPNVLSDKELKNILKSEEKRQKLLLSTNLNQKSELLLDILCLSYHVVTTLKEPLHLTLREVVDKYFQTNTKEVVDIENLVFRSQTGKTLSKNMTIRGALTLNGSCIFVCYNERPFSLPRLYPMDISVNNPRNAIPQVVFNLCWWIYTYGYLVEGIFRVSGNSDFTKKKAEKCVYCDTSFLFEMRRRVNDVHNVVGTLKTYLRECTDGLVDYELIKKMSAHRAKQVEFVVGVFKETPTEHVLCFTILYGLINRLVKYDSIHMMTLKNFAMILGPLIVHTPAGGNPLNTTCNQIDFSNIILNNYDEIIQLLGLSNPFDELPERDDIKKFDKSAVDKALKTIRSMSMETPAECEKLRKMMDNPDVIQYIQSLDPALLVDVVSVIAECLSY